MTERHPIRSPFIFFTGQLFWDGKNHDITVVPGTRTCTSSQHTVCGQQIHARRVTNSRVSGGFGILVLLPTCILAMDTIVYLKLRSSCRTNIPRFITLKVSGSLGTLITKRDYSLDLTSKELEIRLCDNGIDVYEKPT